MLLTKGNPKPLAEQFRVVIDEINRATKVRHSRSFTLVDWGLATRRDNIERSP